MEREVVNRTTVPRVPIQHKDSNNPRVQERHRGVPLPVNYVYAGDNSGDGRHDYCTKSPDQRSWLDRPIDFYGPCARHDLCMDEADMRGQGYGGCNRRLGDDRRRQCDNTYSIKDAAVIRKEAITIALNSCKANAAGYEGVVSGAHDDENQMVFFEEYCYYTNPGAENKLNAPECLPARNGQRR